MLNAACRNGTSTTSTCSTTTTPIEPHSQRFANSRWNAETVSERELRALNNWARTRVVNAAVCASAYVWLPSNRPPGCHRSIVSRVTRPITRPMLPMSCHIRRSITRSAGSRGGTAITSSICGSTPIARAGAESVTRLIQRIWVASSGSAIPPGASGCRPIGPASTTPRKMVKTSPMLELSR
ncbi:hypothetical protein SDC9_147458 [bioreactor metagenome]|uniref:Uncharacterized protein n=1 Tax=bioreactor metagenome TaxID=1076179 RepID=A0A645EHN3_9ZZZZ